MKKILLTLLALFLSFSLTACGSDEEKEENKGGEKTSEVETDEGENNNSVEDVAEKIKLYSDDTKMVFKNGNTQLVYYYSGDKITAYHAYIDYETAALANLALSTIEENDTAIAKAYTNGRYLVVEYAESEYENTTVKEIRALYSYLEQIQEK